MLLTCLHRFPHESPAPPAHALRYYLRQRQSLELSARHRYSSHTPAASTAAVIPLNSLQQRHRGVLEPDHRLSHVTPPYRARPEHAAVPRTPPPDRSPDVLPPPSPAVPQTLPDAARGAGVARQRAGRDDRTRAIKRCSQQAVKVREILPGDPVTSLGVIMLSSESGLGWRPACSDSSGARARLQTRLISK